jgi:hypothetical protein
MLKPSYDIDKIKFGVDKSTFERAVDLYESGKVRDFKEEYAVYEAVVYGTRPYKVSVFSKNYDSGSCECYLGKNDTLCKHMIAVAIHAIKGGKKLTEEEKEIMDSPVCSGEIGELSKEEVLKTKKDITSAMKCVKSYRGPSRTWHANQRSLDEGCARLSKIVSELPVGEVSARLIVDMLIRLDKKLCGGVDDSNGIVGGFMYEVVEILQEYTEFNPACINSFTKLCRRKTCFEWDEPLMKILDEQEI